MEHRVIQAESIDEFAEELDQWIVDGYKLVAMTSYGFTLVGVVVPTGA